MTKHLFLTILSLSFFINYSQNKMTITLKDGTQKTGVYTIRKGTFSNSSSSTKLVSKDKEPKEKISLDDFTSVLVYAEDKELHYFVIDVKTNFKDKKTEKKLGLLAYSGPKINMYLVSETITSGGSFGVSFSSDSYNTYLKKSTDEIAYNMGYIYGAGARGIKKRVRDYFTDCPALVEKVDKDVIDKDKTIDIVQFYENDCN